MWLQVRSAPPSMRRSPSSEFAGAVMVGTNTSGHLSKRPSTPLIHSQRICLVGKLVKKVIHIKVKLCVQLYML